MARGGRPLFLERGGYRQRRLMDAVRLVVILAAGLWMIPLLWPTGDVPEGEAISMSRALFYVFGVWALVIAVSAYLALRVRHAPDDAPGQETDP
jgi:heme/copper-type cytochrome/quinol oxidase subunit 2